MHLMDSNNKSNCNSGKNTRRNAKGRRYFPAGPPPSTERGKRRQANRNDHAQQHAAKCWNGGYTVGEDQDKKAA
jgi:hypothetical protein